ncbi:MAG TPA: sulfurtransferase TusA family protein [Mycobacteriales bacterium]|nr:sulfurtransferase TusA family protein [Mycobacteriales bacterium]
MSAGPSPEPDVCVDCRGRPCPVPVVELARAVADAAVGAVVEVVSDDPAARHDVPAWARMRGQEYLGEAPREGGTGYRVRRTG